MAAVIRQYDPMGSDGSQIGRVCCDAAFLGQPIDSVFRDRSFFTHFMVTPYLVLEPHNTWVAEDDGKIIGYLNASMLPLFSLLRLQMVTAAISMELMPRYLIGQYDRHPRSKRFAEFLMTEAPAQIPIHPLGAAHYHFNVDSGHRGKGIGTRLLSGFEQMLRRKGIARYYAEVLSSPQRRPEEYFVDLGYHIYDRVPTTAFEAEVPELCVLCVVKETP